LNYAAKDKICITRLFSAIRLLVAIHQLEADKNAQEGIIKRKFFCVQQSVCLFWKGVLLVTQDFKINSVNGKIL
jgi:hypothetical protein